MEKLFKLAVTFMASINIDVAAVEGICLNTSRRHQNNGDFNGLVHLVNMLGQVNELFKLAGCPLMAAYLKWAVNQSYTFST